MNNGRDGLLQFHLFVIVDCAHVRDVDAFRFQVGDNPSNEVDRVMITGNNYFHAARYDRGMAFVVALVGAATSSTSGAGDDSATQG
jgi:hypothetical protein